MNITLWECYFTEAEQIEGGTASVQYHLLSPNHLNGSPDNPQPHLIKMESSPNPALPVMAALPMVVGGREIHYRFHNRPEYETETFLISDTWVVQTEVDLIRSTPQEIVDNLSAIWDARGLSSVRLPKPLSAKSVGEWLETLEFDDKYTPARWVTMNEVVQVANNDTETAARAIQQIARNSPTCAAILVHAIPLNTPNAEGGI